MMIFIELEIIKIILEPTSNIKTIFQGMEILIVHTDKTVSMTKQNLYNETGYQGQGHLQ